MMSDVIVSKYGGNSFTSSADAEQIRKITRDDSRRKIIVVSAPGRSYEGDTKVTDMLIELARKKDMSIADKIIERYKRICPEASDSLYGFLNERMVSQLPEHAYKDALKSFGEEAAARVLAQLLGAEYADPKELFLVTGDFGNARILPESEARIRRLDTAKTYVVPGFYGYTQDGHAATFSRGGSDLTGAYIAAALGSLIFEKFTDEDGVFAANPTMVAGPTKIDELTFKELRDLSYSGFNIFHPEAMGPVEKKRIPVHIRKFSLYPKEGTYVVYDRLSEPRRPVVGIAYQNGFCSFDIEVFGLNEQIGIARKILQVFEDECISIEYMPSAIDDISVILKEDQIKGAHKINNIVNRLYSLMNGATISFQEHLGCLAVAGKGLKGRRGISADIQKTLADAGINIRFISQGSQERCIIYGIDSADGKKAVNAVYEKYLR